TPARIHRPVRTMQAGLITCHRRISPRSRRRPSRTARMRRLSPETRNMSKGYSLWVLVLLVAAAPAFAQGPESPPAAPAPEAQAVTQGVPWSSLSPDQQKLLGRFSGNWSTLPAERQQALARGSNRWLGMSPEQRGQAQQRFQRWRSLPPAQRRMLRDRWE